MLDIKQLMVEANDDSEHDYYKTQYALLKSRSLAAQVIRDLGLQDNPSFSGSNQPKGFLGGHWSSFKSWARRLSSERTEARAEPADVDAADAPLGIPGVKPGLISAYLADLEIQPQVGTRLVKISFSTPDPKLSATSGQRPRRGLRPPGNGTHSANESGCPAISWNASWSISKSGSKVGSGT